MPRCQEDGMTQSPAQTTRRLEHHLPHPFSPADRDSRPLTKLRGSRASTEEVSALVEKHRGGIATGVVEYLTGSFNVCARIGFLNGADAIIRFPKPSVSWPLQTKRFEMRFEPFWGGGVCRRGLSGRKGGGGDIWER